MAKRRLSPQQLNNLALQSVKLEPRVFADAVRRVDRLILHERSLADKVDRRVQRWAEGFLGRANNLFYRAFINRWDLPTAVATKTLPALDAAVTDTMLEVSGDLAPLVLDSVQDARDDGFFLTLWDLYKNGVVGDEVFDTEGLDDEDFTAWVAASAIGGLTLGQRVYRWLTDAPAQLRNGLRATIAAEGTLNDTGMLIDTTGEKLVDRVTLLGASEQQRGFYDGQQRALRDALGPALYRSLYLGDLWLTRKDGKVCLICATLHGKLTTLEPVDDSHPGCRCVKVPLLRWDELGDRVARPIDYDEFLASFEDA